MARLPYIQLVESQSQRQPQVSPIKHVKYRPEHSPKLLFQRTISAQLHLLGCLAAIIGLVVLVNAASAKPEAAHLWACLIFGVTGIAVFAASTFYHFMSDGYQISDDLERILSNLDHFAIYLFIAGTYTPFLLNVLSGPWRTYLIVAIWVFAALGIFHRKFGSYLPKFMQHRYFSTFIYVLMGWTLMVRAPEAFAQMNLQSKVLLVAGGLSYTFGAVIYAIEKPNPFPGWFGNHEIWHLAVMAGFGFHYFLILGFY